MLDSLRFAHAMLVARTARRNEEGATAVEYGLMVALIAVAIIIVVGTLGTNLSDLFDGVGGELAPPAGGAGAGAGGV